MSQRLMNGRTLRRLIMAHQKNSWRNRTADIVVRIPLSVLPNPPPWSPPSRWGAVTWNRNDGKLDRLRDGAKIDFLAADEYAAWFRRYTDVWATEVYSEDLSEPARSILEVYAVDDHGEPWVWVYDGRWCILLKIYWPSWKGGRGAVCRAVRALRDLQRVAVRYGFSLHIGGAPRTTDDPDWTVDIPETKEGFVIVRSEED